MKHILVVDSITGTFHPENIKKTAYSFYKRTVFHYIDREVDMFFAITDGARRWLVEEFGVAPERIELIPLGSDTDLFDRSIAKRKEIRQTLGLSDDAVLIVYSGKIIPEKELGTLVLAVASLPHNSRHRVHILLVGDGQESYIERISRLADIRGLSDQLHLHAAVHRTHLPDYYSAADIGVWPGSPSNSIIEAMSTELPIIIAKYQSSGHEAHDSYGLFSYQYDTSNLLEYKNGLRFARGSFEQLAKCIEKLVEDDRLRRSMGLQGRRLAEEKLNWNEISKRTLKVYERILSSCTRDPPDIA
jgi:glycosyltransferase involved in cell wall biosynthesis